MFGVKQSQEEILKVLATIEKQHRDNYHSVTADVAGIHNEIEQITSFLKELDLEGINDTFQQVIDAVDYLQDVIEAITIDERKERAE